MTVYFKAGKGYRYDFMVKGKRYTKAWFKGKQAAKTAEVKRREDVEKKQEMEATGDMALLDLLNLRLDYLLDRAYSESHYKKTKLAAKRLLDYFGKVPCSAITRLKADEFLMAVVKERTPVAGNNDLKVLRAAFSWGMKRGQRFIQDNPFAGLETFPSDKPSERKKTPRVDELDRMIEAAQPKHRPYLWVLRETLARSIEVHRLTWNRVNFEERYVELETRKNKKREPVLRQVPMTDKLYEVLSDQYANRDPGKEWVFWTRSYNAKTGRMEEGPYKRGRYSMLKKVCRDAGVDYYTFHRFRASGASVMDNSGALLPGIQHILGHADRRSTEIYLEKLRDVERDAMDVYERESRKDDDKVA
ncbi:tyrosine-type recombinase/integrase [Pseudodesulfovibrio indicus]|uniref:Integrase n=1 Tax=Pseudodesulfovibrio indicus TaxID=1716143 RepID=A0A126QK59_9BACT|nr:tyrosine-type recombinase/integrase [Pseudodesulfovibrio indicus]AMK10166.1 integrase [Pseudodesulfovibrio indicus]TDT87873.1 site-specific recombinase XerD [Pseudodesulfovibrio indicus]